MSFLRRTFICSFLTGFFLFFLVIFSYMSYEESDPYAGIPGVAAGDKVVVMGQLESEDTTWAEAELPEWRSAIYHVANKSAPLHTTVNKGRETLPYLTYIVDHYEDLPSVIAFVHSHKDGYPEAWHVDVKGYSNVRALQMLRTGVVKAKGYVNLRCNGVPGCPEGIKPFRGSEEPDGEREMKEVWQALLGDNGTDKMSIPEVLAAPCCGQFAVSKETVWKRPREDYIKYRDWVLKTKLPDDTVGRIFEYLWHIIFGENPVYCPKYKTCQCEVYGRFCR